MKSVPESSFWAITAYFNATGSRRRRENFQRFAALLDVPLLVVELSPDGAPSLPQSEHCRVISLRGNPGIWQKERLLNLAVSRLPEQAAYVAWLDCDVILQRADWADQARGLLDRGARLVQLFSVARQIAPDQPLDGLDSESLFRLHCTDFSQSFARAYRKGIVDDDQAFASLVDTWDGNGQQSARDDCSRPQTGFAWAARRVDLQRWGFYEHFVVGGGDRAFCFAAADRADVVLRERPLTDAHRLHYLSWARQLAAGVNRRIDYLDSELRHFWHGSVRNRRYRERFNILLEHDYDPDRDVITGPGGALEWLKPTGRLAAEAAAYFRGRQEDG